MRIPAVWYGGCAVTMTGPVAYSIGGGPGVNMTGFVTMGDGMVATNFGGSGGGEGADVPSRFQNKK
jgi:hypothetical protein